MRRTVFVMIVVVVLGVSGASAQSAAPPSSPEDWQFEVVPYLWGTGIDGPVGVHSRNFSNARIASTGWRSRVPLKDGIALTYPWVAEQVMAERRGHEQAASPARA